MDRQPFLLEIGCEELPVAYIEPALGQLARDFAAWFAELGLGHGPIHAFATPRRLAILVEDLLVAQPDRSEEVTGPPVAKAFAEGRPTAAALGFARGQGVDESALYQITTARGDYVAVRKHRPGRSAAELLAEGAASRILGLQFPKTMTWGDGSLRFARPIRWLVLLLGEEIVPCVLGPLRASRTSRGRRGHALDQVEIQKAADYVGALAAAGVWVDARERRARCLELARRCAAELGGRLVEDEELADTVNYLVEEPAALAGRFDESFLALPREVVSTAMKSHQRYFSVEDAAGGLMPGFVMLLNGPRKEPEVVRAGNERVLRARLADARFYWEEDRRLGLAGLSRRLEDVLWLEGFGSLADRGRRLARLALLIADSLPAPALDRELLDWAARICKADLASEMIKDGKEFTRLQGYMGQEYARAEGAGEARAGVLFEHTLPRFAGDRLPASPEGVILALADRLDAVAGFWSAGFAPTGSKDPYGLRRMSLAVLRLLLERELPLCLSDLIDAALAGYPQADRPRVHPEILAFFLGRLEGRLEEEGVAPDIFDAVVGTGETRVLDLRARALALNGLRGDAAFEKLVIGARRVANILRKEARPLDAAQAFVGLEEWAASPPRPRFGFRTEGLAEEGERDLWAALAAAAPVLFDAAQARNFEGAYRRLAALGPGIDAYFDRILVNCQDSALRENRLAFLQNLAQVFLVFADFSKVVLEGEREKGES